MTPSGRSRTNPDAMRRPPPPWRSLGLVTTWRGYGRARPAGLELEPTTSRRRARRASGAACAVQGRHVEHVVRGVAVTVERQRAGELRGGVRAVVAAGPVATTWSENRLRRRRRRCDELLLRDVLGQRVPCRDVPRVQLGEGMGVELTKCAADRCPELKPCGKVDVDGLVEHRAVVAEERHPVRLVMGAPPPTAASRRCEMIGTVLRTPTPVMAARPGPRVRLGSMVRMSAMQSGCRNRGARRCRRHRCWRRRAGRPA